VEIVKNILGEYLSLTGSHPMSKKEMTFFTVNCAGKFESANQCKLK
jgi:hypothetical protein